MYQGILPVNKPRGLTSHDVVFKLRKILKMKKIGHTGTLDPEVDGVLSICLGSATKVSDYIMEMGKTYVATVTLGYSTTTEDQTGDILEREHIEDGRVTATEVDQTLQEFKGTITQIPPMYSSVKVKGRKLYEYAREGLTVERPSHKVRIDQIERTSELRFTNGVCEFDIKVTCGKGTYIRTLATDIGRAMHLPAHMSRLTRQMSGGFKLEEALSLEEIRTQVEQDSLQSSLYPIEYGLKGLPQIQIQDEQLKQRILNGQKLNKQQLNFPDDRLAVMVDASTNSALAIYMPHPDLPAEIKPKKVFN
ncbi:tRNA pseudouridine(55) synthase TruB [Staphylococcus argensis]|uniref:tRNA pseudouridine synthase B n=1 Tax=Staphylococcus argensis TaxID=1607738 RepID=A0A2K4FES1_9STAP|nr:tRNA pseudouridine(55) synthase TruB [Staphylococcus argensis]MCY6990326.1 tRNA pseudouridine(55) synthase TruB [Staphylococcus argensis]POA09842.1 tRNA pseudouridine(55) synthase TruB [Staphylococcus argensis]